MLVIERENSKDFESTTKAIHQSEKDRIITNFVKFFVTNLTKKTPRIKANWNRDTHQWRRKLDTQRTIYNARLKKKQVNQSNPEI